MSNLSEDRVLRQLLALVLATLRTNFWRTGPGHSGAPGPRRGFVSFKFESARVPGLPEPKPLYEIFVYSPRFEGIHLRGGKVARGGLRWSDRPEDFRTEVLGLMKAQMVKNAVIVPVGSKGGFYVKRPPVGGTREQVQAELNRFYYDTAQVSLAGTLAALAKLKRVRVDWSRNRDMASPLSNRRLEMLLRLRPRRISATVNVARISSSLFSHVRRKSLRYIS